MKRLLPALLLTPLLWACGTAATPALSIPDLSAGELLATPTQMLLGGVKLRAEAQPYLLAAACQISSCAAPNFIVPVQLQASNAGVLNTLRLTGIYVITEGGVWRSGVQARDNRLCLSRGLCLQAVGRGEASLPGGGPAQVVLMFRDSAGHSYRLRDEQAMIDAGE